MANTGSTESVVQTGSPSTEASSAPSAAKDKSSTKKTRKPDPLSDILLLEILEDVLTRCKQRGWGVEIGKFFEGGDRPKVGIVMDGIDLEGNKLVPLMANTNEKAP